MESADRAARIEAVADASADDDRLVTVAVAHDESLGSMLERVEEAHAKAEYLDGRASEPLREAYEAAARALRDVGETPADGLVVYAGVFDGDSETFVFADPPGRVEESRFEHGNAFVTEPLEGGGTGTATVALVVVERGGAALGRLDESGVTALETLDSDVPGKTRAGGQSADRFRRRREERKREFFASVGEAAGRVFDDPDAVALGGTDVTVAAFREGEHLPGRLASRLAGTYAVSHADPSGLDELASKARGDVTSLDAEVREALAEFFERLPDGEVAYGRETVDDALTYGAVERLLVAETVPASERETYAKRVEDEGGKLVVVPRDVAGGDRFVEGFDGVGALLRFPVE
ncbi:peptide chain release factor subunit 1 [Halarchaeum rubridurum]|uniref:Peptide chain release factor subunit 1 n=1 Tax=Halarchaeum rubridurum TaxID=489911 RepID=A0A830G127_9EURY|nr:Vms1/Ankzf1 family peptidyl-tRNA hydrolase [Halarchaeum rubridurum]MBP1954957.1 peptide chain release factor subunit 1 [Halarchaeum rubridurum]GGM70125.1 hypothetical protein GCM10009017_20340 [Halarchaeum rubridurum]